MAQKDTPRYRNPVVHLSGEKIYSTRKEITVLPAAADAQRSIVWLQHNAPSMGLRSWIDPAPLRSVSIDARADKRNSYPRAVEKS